MLKNESYASKVHGITIVYRIIGQLRARDVPDEDDIIYNLAHSSLGTSFCYPVLIAHNLPTPEQLDEYISRDTTLLERHTPLRKQRIRHRKKGGTYTICGWCWNMLHEQWFPRYVADVPEENGIRDYTRPLDRLESQFELVT